MIDSVSLQQTPVNKVFRIIAILCGISAALCSMFIALRLLGLLPADTADAPAVRVFQSHASLGEVLDTRHGATPDTGVPLDSVVIALNGRSNPAAGRLYSREALAAYWLRLNQGGQLVLASDDETLYQRALLTFWEILQAHPANGSDRLVEQATGYRMLAGSPRFLLVAAKEPKGHRLADAAAWAASRGGIALFGPDVMPAQSYDVRIDPYNILYHPEGLDMARNALTQAASWHLQAEADLRAATDDRPFFTVIGRDLPALLKTGLAVSLGLLALILLLPLMNTRRLAHTFSRRYAPLPVYLGYFAVLAACWLFAALSLGWRGPLWVAAATTLPAGMLLFAGLHLIPAELGRLVPWAWLAAGTTAPGAAIAAYWLALEWGWRSMWLACAAGIIALLGLGLWMRWPLRRQQATS